MATFFSELSLVLGFPKCEFLLRPSKKFLLDVSTICVVSNQKVLVLKMMSELHCRLGSHVKMMMFYING